MASSKKDICVIGVGKFGTAIINQLVEMKKHVFAIDSDEARLIQVSRITSTAVADASDIEALKSLGINQFNTVIVAAEDNVEIVAAIIELGVKHVIAKAKSMRHERVLRQIGVDVVINPDSETGIRTALIATNANFIKYSELLQEVGDGFAIGSTIVNNIQWLGKPLSELKFSKYGISVVSVRREGKVYLPNGQLTLRSGDTITVIGKISSVTEIFGELNDEGSTKLIQLSKINKATEEANKNRSK